MKVKSSVLFGLIVLTCLAGGISLIYRLTKEAEVWNPSEMYKTSLGTSKGTKCTTVSYASGSTSDAPLVQLGAGSMSRPRVSFSYAPAGVTSAYTQYPIGGTPSNSVASPIYTTSSAELRSFGGGGNGGGVSMSGGSVHSSGSAVSAPSMGLSATMPNGSLFTFAGQNTNANIPIVSGDAAIAAVASASSYTAAYSGIGYTTGGASRGIGGRKNLGIEEGNVEDSWLNWLALMGKQYGHEENGEWKYDIYDLRDAYDAYCAGWNYTMGKKPTWDEWLAWFMGSEGDPYMWDDGDKQYGFSFVPVGDYTPLFVLALLYVAVVAYRRRKQIICEKQ
ncbi:MAG: hypothetical protein IKV31_00150 [Paludibacteraceae bacterium]|nr:hypothetical protein [Paludibacteraceae bacterium]